MKLIDRTNQRYGRLFVTGRSPKPEHVTIPGAWWFSDCDCGKKDHPVSGVNLGRGQSSCGCFQREHCATIGRSGNAARWHDNRLPPPFSA